MTSYNIFSLLSLDYVLSHVFMLQNSRTYDYALLLYTYLILTSPLCRPKITVDYSYSLLPYDFTILQTIFITE